jgi:hypothetical protein
MLIFAIVHPHTGSIVHGYCTCHHSRTRNDWEAYAASSEILAHTFQYVSDEKLNNTFRRMGYAEDEFAGLRKKR